MSLKKIPYRFSCVSSFNWSYRSILIKVRFFFQILAGRRSSYGNQEEEISPQTSPPPPHHCVLCKKSLRELAVFKLFTILFPPFRVKILLNQSICKVSKIFHCIFINTENGAIFVPLVVEAREPKSSEAMKLPTTIFLFVYLYAKFP